MQSSNSSKHWSRELILFLSCYKHFYCVICCLFCTTYFLMVRFTLYSFFLKDKDRMAPTYVCRRCAQLKYAKSVTVRDKLFFAKRPRRRPFFIKFWVLHFSTNEVYSKKIFSLSLSLSLIFLLWVHFSANYFKHFFQIHATALDAN